MTTERRFIVLAGPILSLLSTGSAQADPVDPLLPLSADTQPAAAVVEGFGGPEIQQSTLLPGSDALPSLSGSVGLYRLSAAEVGALRHLRVGLHGQYFSGDSFLVEGDSNVRLHGGLALGFTPIRSLEVFGSLAGSANRNRRTNDPNRNDPEVIKAYGDAAVGTKYVLPVANGFAVGAEGGLQFLSSVSGLSFDPSATSFWLGALGTWQAGAVFSIPLRAHLNAGFFIDNSTELYDFERVGLLSKAVSSFAYGIAKDRFRAGVGVEWPFDNVVPGLSVRPLAEYHLELVTAEADAQYAAYQPPLCRGSSASAGSTAKECRDNRDQHWMTLGLRAQAKSGFSVDLGLDIGLRSVGFPYGSPLPPYNIILGISHPLDLGGPRVVTRTVTVEKVVPVEQPRKEGFIAGKVMSARGQAPVEGAIVGVAGRERSRVASDPDGAFRSVALSPGTVELTVSAPGFVPLVVRSQVDPQKTTELAVTLEPQEPAGKVSGRIFDENGRPIQGTVKFSGPQSAEAAADVAGVFRLALPPGVYLASVDTGRHLKTQRRVHVAEGPLNELELALRIRPAISAVSMGQQGKLLIKQRVAFRVDGQRPTAELAPASHAVLDELIDFLAGRPEIKVRVEAHWDSTLGQEQTQRLTDDQARAITAYLVARGVGEDRVLAVGMGAKKPKVPNIGIAGRNKNRRVEFHVLN